MQEPRTIVGPRVRVAQRVLGRTSLPHCFLWKRCRYKGTCGPTLQTWKETDLFTDSKHLFTYCNSQQTCRPRESGSTWRVLAEIPDVKEACMYKTKESDELCTSLLYVLQQVQWATWCIPYSACKSVLCQHSCLTLPWIFPESSSGCLLTGKQQLDDPSLKIHRHKRAHACPTSSLQTTDNRIGSCCSPAALVSNRVIANWLI